jgi:hypothetical protein
MAATLVPPMSHRNRWIRVCACMGCGRVRAIVKSETVDVYDVFTPNRRDEPCEDCGMYVAPEIISDTAIAIRRRIGHLTVRTARWTSSRIWYNPLTWFDRGSWELFEEPSGLRVLEAAPEPPASPDEPIPAPPDPSDRPDSPTDELPAAS